MSPLRIIESGRGFYFMPQGEAARQFHTDLILSPKPGEVLEGVVIDSEGHQVPVSCTIDYAIIAHFIHRLRTALPPGTAFSIQEMNFFRVGRKLSGVSYIPSASEPLPRRRRGGI